MPPHSTVQYFWSYINTNPQRKGLYYYKDTWYQPLCLASLTLSTRKKTHKNQSLRVYNILFHHCTRTSPTECKATVLSGHCPVTTASRQQFTPFLLQLWLSWQYSQQMQYPEQIRYRIGLTAQGSPPLLFFLETEALIEGVGKPTGKNCTSSLLK